mmetsp:Transcript_28257/g.51087  ORF Transcript_28257/g.51087 Transcript_28257/m.51087 type:complete len:227 (+) Transcript_28257:275-955(+)
MITTANRSNAPTTSAIMTLAKIQPGGRIPRQLSVGRTTHLAGHIRNNILSEQTLDILGDVLPTNDKTLITIDTPLGTQLGHEELKDVLGTALHHGADFLEVNPERLLGPDAGELRRLHGTALLLDEVGILRVQDAHDAVEHVLVGVVGLAVVHVLFLAVGRFELRDDEALFREAGVIVACAGWAGCGVLLFLVLLLTLLLLFFAQIEHFSQFFFFLVRHGCVRYCC